MMIACKSLIGGLLGAVAFVAAASAADMPGTWSPPELEKPRFVELLSGWYLRADVGYRWNRVDGLETTFQDTGHRTHDAVGATLGAGYKYQWFRADVTLDYGSPHDFNVNTAAPVVQPQYNARIDTVSGLLNGYIDFGTWWGFTPYVGGGVGATYVRSQHYFDTSISTTSFGQTRGQTNFSWAWMAGVAFQIKPQLLIDVGYRHLDLGGVRATAGTGAPTDFMEITKHSTNEVRIGVRYLLD
jgi:opacity protein-like surface antigen